MRRAAVANHAGARAVLPSLALLAVLLLASILAGDASSAAIAVESIARLAFAASVGVVLRSLVAGARGGGGPGRSGVSSTIVVFMAASFALSLPASVGLAAELHGRLFPDRSLVLLCEALRTSSREPGEFSGRRGVLQARGIGDAGAIDLAEALEIHFDRRGRNETEPFPTVERLNLIGNVFGTSGAKAISKALVHESAYTNTLLLGRNRRLGDGALLTLAEMMEANRAVKWISIGGPTGSMTEEGFSALFSSLADRPTDFLGLDYNHCVRPHLHMIGRANALGEIDLTGTRLGDARVPALVDAIHDTNITALGLTNNGIGPGHLLHSDLLYV